MTRKKHFTDFLFPRTSFLKGMGSVFNIAGNYYQFDYSSNGWEADKKAIASDWGINGQDLRSAMQDLDNMLDSLESEND